MDQTELDGHGVRSPAQVGEVPPTPTTHERRVSTQAQPSQSRETDTGSSPPHSAPQVASAQLSMP